MPPTDFWHVQYKWLSLLCVMFLKKHTSVICYIIYVSDPWNDESLHNLAKYLSRSHLQSSDQSRVEKEQTVKQKAEMLGLEGLGAFSHISKLDDLSKLTGDGQLKERLIQHLKSTQNTVSVLSSFLVLVVYLWCIQYARYEMFYYQTPHSQRSAHLHTK